MKTPKRKLFRYSDPDADTVADTLTAPPFWQREADPWQQTRDKLTELASARRELEHHREGTKHWRALVDRIESLEEDLNLSQRFDYRRREKLIGTP